MTIMSRFPAGFPARTALVSALVACALPLEAAAQSIGYGDVSGGADAPTAGQVGLSAGVAVVGFLLALVSFRSHEREFADVI